MPHVRPHPNLAPRPHRPNPRLPRGPRLGAFHGLKDEVQSLLSEAGELAELFRWYEGEHLAAHVEGRKEDVADELADVLYWTLLLANDVGVDLAAAFERKVVKNEAKYPVDASRGRAAKYTEL